MVAAPDPDKQALFPPKTNDPPARTFELGLVLGGTVSAGAYTAGALDLLVQAIDDFYARNDGKPPHSVKLSLAAGSSGGAVCAALLGATLNRRFPHLTGAQSQLNVDGAGPADNPFWDLWVNRFNFSALMSTDDLHSVVDDGNQNKTPQHVPALLNGAMIDNGAAALVNYANAGGDVIRPWSAQPFRIAATACNLRGIPYTIKGIPTYSGYTGYSFVEHDDYAWFAAPNGLRADDTGDDQGKRRPDEFWLSISPRQGVSVGFDILANYARASGSMPIGLPARPLSRPPEHYVYRPEVRPLMDGNYQIDWPQPDWPELSDVMVGNGYSFTAVDGGTLNNDPVKIAHRALAGLIGVNPRDGSQANRAMFMIDPLADQPSSTNGVGLSLVAVAKALIGTFVGGARYLTADLELFADEQVFSRFQLVPNRSDPSGGPTPLVGEKALAGTDFQALAGWLARPYRVHDYLLGRWNMVTYLRREFLLPANNPIFAGWTFNERSDCACNVAGDRTAITEATNPNTYWLPIIPLPPDNFETIEPEWPKVALDRQQLTEMVEARADAVLSKLRADNLPGIGPWFLSLLGLSSVSDALARDVVKSIFTALQKRGLVDP